MYNYFTAAFNSFPALKAGAFEAAICISSPVCGLHSVRADLSRTSNVPNSRICTFSSLASALVIASNTACVAASFWGSSAFLLQLLLIQSYSFFTTGNGENFFVLFFVKLDI